VHSFSEFKKKRESNEGGKKAGEVKALFGFIFATS
jgi:hypothetical protein